MGQTADILKALTTPVNVELAECRDGPYQHYRIEYGFIKSELLDGKCLTAETATAKANLQLETCVSRTLPGSATQKWVMTQYGSINLQNTDLCIDVLAAMKADDFKEKWDEFKKNDVTNVQLDNCYNPKETDYVNQMWTWTPGSQLPGVLTVIDDIDASFAAAEAAAASTALITAAPTAAATVAAAGVTTAAPAATTVSGAGTAAAGASASMPSSVAAAMGKQALTVKYLDESRASLSAKTVGGMVPALVGVAVTTSVVALLGLHRWYTHEDPVSDDEVQALETELNHF